jgi:hypothetical protein
VWILVGRGLKILVSMVQSVPAHHFFHPLARQKSLPDVSVCPDWCPSQARSTGFQRTSVVQAVATPSFQIQVERALMTRPVFFFGLRFDLPDALWQDRRKMRGAFIRAVPRQEPEPRSAMTENGFYVSYAQSWPHRFIGAPLSDRPLAGVSLPCRSPR